MAYKYSKGSRGFGDITFEDDADTGIDFEADTVKLETGGTERLVVTNSGVGIGISSPSTTLHVYSDASDAYVATIDNDAGSNAHGLKVTSDGTGTGTTILDIEAGSTTVFKVRGDGRVGIGVTTPGSTLSVDDEIAVGEKLIHRGDPDTYLQFPGQNQINLVANGHSFLKYDGDILINNANRDRDTKIMADDGAVVLHVDAGNNSVGIGTTSPNSTLSANGSLSLPIAAKTSDYTATGSDYTILLNASSNNVTITLPAVSGITGRMYVLKRADGSGNTATVASNGSETIDNSTANVILSPGQSVTLQTDGTGWHKIAEYIQPE